MGKRIIGQNGQGVQGLTLIRASTQWNSSRGRFGTLLAERSLTCLSLIVLTEVLLYIRGRYEALPGDLDQFL